MKIVTFNLRCVYDRDGVNSFVHRAVFVRDKINTEKPDVVAFQEVTPKSLEVMQLLLPDYDFFGMFRSESYDTEGLYTAVRKDTCMLMGMEVAWLSPTPEVAGSRFECQSHCPRICLYTQVLHRATKKRISLFNIHLDHISHEARCLGMQAAFDFAARLGGGAPKVFLGDLNAAPDSAPLALFGNYSELCDLTAHIPTTFHGYGNDDMKIDYIIADRALADLAVSTEAWTDTKNGIYLSDHYPICTTLDI